jgi:hypothetical protein
MERPPSIIEPDISKTRTLDRSSTGFASGHETYITFRDWPSSVRLKSNVLKPVICLPPPSKAKNFPFTVGKKLLSIPNRVSDCAVNLSG